MDFNQNRRAAGDLTPLQSSGSDWKPVAAFCVALSLIFAFGVLPQTLAPLLKAGTQRLSGPALVALQTLPLQILLLGAVLLPAAFAAKASLRGTLEELTLRWPGRKEVSFALGVEILLFPTLCVATYITKFALTLFGSNFDGTQAAIKQALESSPAGFFALLASSVIIAPVVEELAYRVAVFGCLRSFAGTLPALLATSALFSATHYSPLQAPALFLLGVVLQCLCLHFKSVVPAILLHSLHNLLSMALLFGFRLMNVHPGS